MSSHNEEALYLCLDQGGHASRALVIDGRGNVCSQAFRSIETQRESDRVEHSPAEIVDTLRAAADQAVADLGERAEHIVAAGFATQRSSLMCWRRDSGAALTPVISWQDTRAAEWLATFKPHEMLVHDITGLMLSPHYGVSKLRWCLDNVPAVQQAHAEGQLIMGPLAAFIVNQLLDTSPLLADPANASRTLLWDRRTRDWSPELLELFDIPLECLPASVASRADWGSMTVGNRQLPVTVVTGDQSAALFAFGIPEKNVVYANLGTGAFLQQSVDAQFIAPGRLLASVVYQDEVNVVNVIEATVNGAGSAINAVSAELNIKDSDLRANSADWLEDDAALPIFMNGIAGLGSPWWLANVESRFLGSGSPEQQIAAVLESVIFMLTVNLQAMDAIAEHPDQLLVTGGLGSVQPLLQKFANLSGIAVARPQISEATARGLAFLLAGLPDDWPQPLIEYTIQPQTNNELQQRFLQWRAAMPDIPETLSATR